jgi:hypothetical protein
MCLLPLFTFLIIFNFFGIFFRLVQQSGLLQAVGKPVDDIMAFQRTIHGAQARALQTLQPVSHPSAILHPNIPLIFRYSRPPSLVVGTLIPSIKPQYLVRVKLKIKL